MAERDDEGRTGTAEDVKKPAKRDAGQEEDYHGDSATEDPMAPASAGRPQGGEGTVVPGARSPDGRPVSPETRDADAERGSGETPVGSPVDRSEGQGVRSGSAAGAAAAAGSGAPGREGGDHEEGVLEEDAGEEGGGKESS